jgi:hypothetical protein
MTELSPAAQKALAAFNERHELCGPFDDDWAEQCLAAALEAVADQVVPDEPSYMRDAVASLDWWGKHDSIRAELLAIAAELRGTTATQENN